MGLLRPHLRSEKTELLPTGVGTMQAAPRVPVDWLLCRGQEEGARSTEHAQFFLPNSSGSTPLGSPEQVGTERS